jgi:2-polyprenyl-3-methyl-5-hydroxy-6-metoxy-1,4-benzoquinol methylase
MSNDSRTVCHLCGGVLHPGSGFSDLIRVTSDSRPWRRGGAVARCLICGAVQKPVDAGWQQECAEIYGSYSIYHQSEGREQPVFDKGGQATPRSHRLAASLAQHHDLPARGRLLDVGCGNGAFLAAFGAVNKGWRSVGVEVNDRYRTEVEALPGVERLHVGDVDGVDGRFDLIALIHCLEHVPGPADFLRKLSARLAPGGAIFVQVPSFRDNPFDLLIADHCTHFTRQTLTAVAAEALGGSRCQVDQWVSRELSLVIRRESSDVPDTPPEDPAEALQDAIATLRTMRDGAKAAPGPVGIFGTSIGGTWMAAELGAQAAFFLDEDGERVGRKHLGLPILSPSQPLPPHAGVSIPLPVAVAETIMGRWPGISFLG